MLGTAHAVLPDLNAKVCSVGGKSQRAMWLRAASSAWVLFVCKKLINKLWIHMNSVCSGTLEIGGGGSITPYFSHINHRLSFSTA